MATSSSSPATSRRAARRRPAAAIVVAFLAAAPPADGATVLSKTLLLEIGNDGAVVETTRLRVRLDADADFDAWSPYAVAVDENVELEDLDAWVEHPGGKVEKSGRSERDAGAASPEWILHGSAEVRSVRFARAGAGAVLAVDIRLRTRPHYPSHQLRLGEPAAIERLEVRLRGPAPLRWALWGAPPELAPSPAADGRELVVAGRLPAPQDLRFAPLDAATGPRLRVNWGADTEAWSSVGRWWEGAMGVVPRDAARVRARALELAPAELAPRERAERLLAFARRSVRYVAVEVGRGAFLAASPESTLERLWGDCKAKAILLVDLLRAAGIESHPVLVTTGLDDRTEAGVPGTDFNHMIVAIEAAGIAEEGDPVDGSLLFVDPTHPRAALGWLPPADQEQNAVLVAGAASRLLVTPVAADRERERLEARLAVAPDGSARGDVALVLEGAAAAHLLELRDGGDRPRLERTARSMLESRLPAAALTALTLGEDSAAPAPRVVLRAAVEASAFATVGEGGASLSLAGSERVPPASTLAGRSVAVVALPGVTERVYALTVPAGWSLQADENGEANALGSFRLALSSSPLEPGAATRAIRIERRTELRRRWIEPASFAELAALSLAEHRGARKRIRLAIAG